ncbi:MAG TPA: ATP-binding protein [Ktedonobacteraceae bacterium]|nr:ATP-binding protein [Ktedonobacteraceae bacterium]
MNSVQPALLEHILERMPIGVVILDCTSLQILYINSYLQSLLPLPWRSQSLIEHSLRDIVPDAEYKLAEPILQEVCSTGRGVTFSDIPHEGFLETRGRTYWQISIELSQSTLVSIMTEEQDEKKLQNTAHNILITIKDVTHQVRSSLHLNAIHQISSAILERFTLPQVLDSILQAVQDLVGSTRCAIVLLEHTVSVSNQEKNDRLDKSAPTAVIAAQKGLHLSSQNWHSLVNEQLLLSQVLHSHHSLAIPDTDAWPSIKFPLLDDNGIPRRPGSVLCVPIFEPDPPTRAGNNSSSHIEYTPDNSFSKKAILGTIEVYHRRARGLPIEEVELLEQFAQQAGLAIQNARLLLSVDQLAQVAREQAHQRENVMQAIPDGVIIYDSRWHIAETNNAIRNLLGWSEEVKGLHISEALSRSTAIFPFSSPSITDLVDELERSPQEKRVDEFKMIGADRQHYSIRRSKAPIQDDSGKIFAYAVVYHDVTVQATAREQIEAQVVARTKELAQQNHALQAAQAAQELESARLRLLVKRLPSGVMLISAGDKRISVINHQAVELLQHMGVPISTIDDPDQFADNTVGLNIEDAFRAITLYNTSGSIIAYEEQPLFRALQNGEASEIELRITQPDDQKFFLLISAAPLYNYDGRITDAVLVLQDFTKLKTLERAREDFFTTMAHELKTPLANIRAHLSALQADDFKWSPQAQHNFLETADEQVERLVGMINHFLDASRIEAGALRLELEPILLPEMFEDLQERLEALITSSQRHFEIHVPSDLPAVQADYEHIMSVLTNLLSNAFRFAPERDTVRLEAEPIFDPSNDQITEVEIRVIDRGPGITEERQAVLFTRFSTFAALRRPTAERPGQPIAETSRGNPRWSPATGLGLYISRGIIEAHGSQLRLKSNPGEGATFAFTLPVATSSNFVV